MHLPFWRQIRWNLILYFVLLAVLPLAIVTVITLDRTRNQARDQALNQLESVAALKATELADWETTSTGVLDVLYAGEVRRNRFDVLAMTTESGFKFEQYTVNALFTEAVAGQQGFKEFFFYGADGTILASSDPVQIGKTARVQPYFDPSLANAHFVQPPFYEVGQDELTMVVTRAVYNDNGVLIGALAGRLDLASLSDLMTEREGLGETGETYLVSLQSNYLLTASRFSGYEVRRSYHSYGIDHALDGQSGSGSYTNYRGKQVFGVYQWIPSLQVAMLAEIEESEALSAYNGAQQTAVLLTVLAALAAAAIGFYAATRFSRPILTLTEAAARITGGNLSERVALPERNELGLLARAFNGMTDQFQDLISSLEARVAARTRDLFLTLEVGQLSTRIYQQEELLPRVVEYIRERFNLYYTQVYLLDEGKRYAILRAGTGEVGEQLLARAHRLDLKQTSIVARAAQSQRPVLVADALASDIHRPNPLLPETRSEVAIPLIVGDEVLGVLDMQARQADTFREDNLPVFEAMANQLASALRSAQSYAETQAAVERATVINRRLTSSAWESYLGRIGEGKPVGYEYDLQNVQPLPEEVAAGDGSASVGNGHGGYVTRPVMLRDQPIGQITLGEDGEREWTAEELNLVENVADQIAQTLEQFRAFDETAAALAQTESLYEASRTIGSATTDQELYDALVQNIRTENLDRVVLGAITGQDSGGGPIVTVTAVWDRAGQEAAFHGNRFTTREMPLLKQMTPRDVILVGDFESPDPAVIDAQTQAVFKHLGVQSAAILPIATGQELFGWLLLETTSHTRRFTDEDVIPYRTLADQAAVALQSLRLFEQTRKRAAEMQTVAEVGAEASAALDIERLLWAVSDLTKERFGLYHAHIYLMDEAGENLVLAAGAGEAGRTMVEAHHSIPVRNERSLVVRAARTREGVFINDVTRAPDFLPNPLLPATRSEIASPMIVGDRVIGVLDVQANQIGYFTQEDLRVQMTLASQVAVAVQNARLFAAQVQTAEQLREVDRLKSEFLASMSHELRTPLNSIIGYAEVLLDGIDGDLTDDMQEDVTAIHGSGKHLLNLINDILDLAKIEAGQMDLVCEYMDLKPLAEDVLNTARVLLRDKSVQLLVDMPDDLPQVYADGLRIRQVLSNLLTNATKFTEEGSITVRARLDDTNPGVLRVSVIDTGIGMTSEQLEVIFDRFRQVDQSHTRRAGGTGLGLSITQQLIDMHGGTIWVESERGTGSTFGFTLPLAAPEA